MRGIRILHSAIRSLVHRLRTGLAASRARARGLALTARRAARAARGRCSPLRLGVIVACCLITGSAAAGPARDRLDAFLNGLDTLSAEFRQVLVDEQGAAVEESGGVLYLARPDRFRWDYEQPYRQLIVADGERLWLYDPDLAQVTTRPQAEALGSTPAALLASTRPVEESFRVTELETDDDDTAWLTLAPLASGASFENIRLGFDREGIRSMELKDSFGQTTRLEFSAIERNPALDGSLFRFTPPEGVDVIRGQ